MTCRWKDPFALKDLLWPHIEFYDKQREVVRSAFDNDVTAVPAANMMGKDFIGGFIALAFFLTRQPCRIVTTSVKGDHLRVLWGEIGRYIQEARYPLDYKRGGPLLINHHEIRYIDNGELVSLSYLIGRVSEKGEGMQGHHIAKTGDGIPRTMFMVDEASGAPDTYFTMASTWADRIVMYGNCWPCENEFRRAYREGDRRRPDGKYYRKVIRIQATDSPNVKLALLEKERGYAPSGRIVVPGVLTWPDYCKRVDTWDDARKCVGLEARFYEGAKQYMYPGEWLALSAQVAEAMLGAKREAKAIGVDPAEGGDSSVWTVVDQFGVEEQIGLKTPDTTYITGFTKELMQQYKVSPEYVAFDRGGGGKQHADRLKLEGYDVMTVGFGESLMPELRRGTMPLDDRRDHREEHYVYKNRRAEMYGMLRERLNPSNGPVFAIHERFRELRRQLSLIPLTYDSEGRLELLPKRKKPGEEQKDTLVGLIGHSPDEADSLVLALYAMERARKQVVAGAIVV